ncbi:hypothetical protein NYE37_02555 [Thermoactinomyces sp. FSL K6-2592]|uniref:hypothetical protein n=1 Tax=Thermoactinomyces sp. FSL K6-2592 TaxID=2975347 RepID=UPI0030F81156
MDEKTYLAYTGWGRYLVDGYWNTAIKICEKLLKHWEGIKAITNYKVGDIARDIKYSSEFIHLAGTRLKNFDAFNVVFFNPMVQEEPYVHRMFISDSVLSISEYDGGKYFKENPALTGHFIQVMKDISRIREIQELWLGDLRAGFMGNIYFLYRPEKIYDYRASLEPHPEWQELLDLLETQLPREVIVETIVREIGENHVEDLNDGKIFVRFYGENLFDIKVDKTDLLHQIRYKVESYLDDKNIKFKHLVY